MLMASLAFISSKSSQIWAGITEAGEIMQPLLLRAHVPDIKKKRYRGRCKRLKYCQRSYGLSGIPWYSKNGLRLKGKKRAWD